LLFILGDALTGPQVYSRPSWPECLSRFAQKYKK